MRVVLDTNLLISALIYRGLPAQLLLKFENPQHALFTSPQLLAELEDVICRNKFAKPIAQEPVGLGASKAKIGHSEDSFCRICRPIAPLWVKKTVKNGPLRAICSRRFPSPTGS